MEKSEFQTQAAVQSEFRVRCSGPPQEGDKASLGYVLAFWLLLRLCWCSLFLVLCIWRGAKGLGVWWSSKPFLYVLFQGTPLFVTPHLPPSLTTCRKSHCKSDCSEKRWIPTLAAVATQWRTGFDSIVFKSFFQSPLVLFTVNLTGCML